MRTLKHKISAAALLSLTIAFVAPLAQAEIRHSEAYEKLTAVPLSPGHAPRLVHGISDLAQIENRHPEKLPVQLDGAIRKIKKRNYVPSGLSRENPSGL